MAKIIMSCQLVDDNLRSKKSPRSDATTNRVLAYFGFKNPYAIAVSGDIGYSLGVSNS